MSFDVEIVDSRPIQVNVFVHGEGEIISGDSKRLKDALTRAGVQSDWLIMIALDSPGGSIHEGLRLGRVISQFNGNTSVGRKSGDVFSSLPGECSSACVLAYLGGRYRYLSKESNLGVHQFVFTSDRRIDVQTATAVSQIVAADIVGFIKL